MNKNGSSPAHMGYEGRNKIKRIITFIIFFIMLLIYFMTFIFPKYEIGYTYYKDNTVQIGVTKQEEYFTEIQNEYLAELEEKGYNICSSELNQNISCKIGIVAKEDINEEQLRQELTDSLDIYIYTYQLSFDGDNAIYYFKTEEDCNKYVEKIKEYQEDVNYNITQVAEKEDIVFTEEDILAEKIDTLKAEKEKKEQEEEAQRLERERTAQLASRERVSKSAPLDNYVYISTYFSSYHTGVDFAAYQGTNVRAWKSGTVVQASWNGPYGNFIAIDHGNGVVSRYAHLSGYAVSAGQAVAAGQLIGYVGSTGNSTGPHLHWEIKINGYFENPLNYL